MRRTTVPLALALGALGAGALTFVACNLVLGIEEGSPRPPPEVDAALPDVVVDPDAGPRVAPPSCTLDSDCVPPSGCYTGHCDTVLGACAYHLCDAPRACAQGTCNPASTTCDAPADYNFRTTRYPVANVALGCKSASSCVAALFPFLFLGTKDGVVALLADDRLAKAAHPVPIRALGMTPGQLVASGRRLWILGDVQGATPPYRVPIAYVDVPSDPTVTELVATTATLELPYPTIAAFPAPQAGLYVVYEDPAQGFPTALLAPPLPDAPIAALTDASTSPPTVPMYRLASEPAGALVVASSGARLLMYRPSVANVIAGPATPAMAAGPDLALTPGLPAFQAPRFAQGPDGQIMLSGPVSADVDCNCTSHARLQWVLSNAIATTLDANLVLDPAGWTNPNAGLPNTTCHACPSSYFIQPALATWIDAHTALTATVATDPDRTLTWVRALGRDPLTGDPKRIAKTAATEVPQGNFATDRVALTSSAGLGYLVLSNGEGNNVAVSIYDPSCDAK